MTDERTMSDFRKNIRRLEQFFAAALGNDSSCCGVTLAQYHTLLAIGERGPAMVTSLARDLGLDKSTLSRTIEALVHGGLVRREVNPRNRRSAVVALTHEGMQTVELINDRWNRYFRSIFSLIPEDSHLSVMAGVDLLVQAMAKIGVCCANDGDDPCEEQTDGKS